MATNCGACDDLRQNAPDFVQNGVTENVCTSLKNDTGMNPGLSPKHTDCEDLNDANDCLIGNLDSEIDAYDVCDWKDFFKKVIPNIYNVIAAVICAVCGAWENIHKLWDKVNYITCMLNQLTKSQNFAISEKNIKWAPGVSKRADDTGLQSVPKITGNAYCGYMTGSIVLSDSWISSHPNKSLNAVGAMVYEYRIKMSDYKLKYIWPGQMQEVANGQGVHAHIQRFGAGQKTYGYDSATGAGSTTVPAGYTYLQVRITSYESLGNGKITLAGVIPVLMDSNKFNC